MSWDSRAALAASLMHELDRRDGTASERNAQLAQLPSIYSYLAGGATRRNDEGVRVDQSALPGGGSEHCRWLGAKERIAAVERIAYREHLERDGGGYCPFTNPWGAN